ncbi:hypothetical protein MKJ04_21990 [Pontibacter sp. E15-1]|uniref:hypothetical protein n=1 Tax=Pontibacter sp. E15-1 TaxID=2919918 RepID=UPI001F4F7D43|nr:hypothetical protein [Pontibacter sp. E15-1]MCJ8167529.1 hypothetical protein [Pontibacter sp. E15-1]
MRKLYCLLLLAAPLLVQAQSKVSSPMAVWPELQASFGVNESGLLFIQNQYRINTDGRFNDLAANGPLQNFERIELALGYEQTLSAHWRAGAVFRYAAEDYPKTAFYTVFLRHSGKVGSLFFNKQLTAEYVGQQGHDVFSRLRLEGELGKRLPLGGRFLTPGIRYEGMVLSGFGGKKSMGTQERVIDRTRLRLNLTYEVTDKLRLTPYFMRQTHYYYVLVPPVYDAQEQLVEEGYTTKRNRISPVLGLEIKYTLNSTPQTASITY